MLNRYPGKKLRNLRRRANLTQIQVAEITGIAETTLIYLERDRRKPQTKTLSTLLNLYAIHITRLEKLERIWGEDGLQQPNKNGDQKCPAKYPLPNLSAARSASRLVSMR